MFLVRKVWDFIIVERLFYPQRILRQIARGEAEIGISVAFERDEIGYSFCDKLDFFAYVSCFENMRFIAI